MIINHDRTTHNIANTGFSGMRRFEARFNFSYTLIGKKPAIPNDFIPPTLGKMLGATCKNH